MRRRRRKGRPPRLSNLSGAFLVVSNQDLTVAGDVRFVFFSLVAVVSGLAAFVTLESDGKGVAFAAAQTKPASSRASAVAILVEDFFRVVSASDFFLRRRRARSAIDTTSTGSPFRRWASLLLTTAEAPT